MLSDEFRKKEEEFIAEAKRSTQNVYNKIFEELRANYSHKSMGCRSETRLFVYRAEHVKDDGTRTFDGNRVIHLPFLIEVINVYRLKDPYLDWFISDISESGEQWFIVTAYLTNKRENLDEFFEYDLETQKMVPARYDEETNSFVRIDPAVQKLKPQTV